MKKKKTSAPKTCAYGLAWRGKCGKPAVAGNRCEEHKDIKCSSCGRAATGECDETQGPMVCGAPLCNRCEHALAPDGTNSGSKHIRKGTQKYKGWWAQGDDEKRQGKYLMLRRDLDGYEHVAEMIGGEKGQKYLQDGSDILRRIAAEINEMETKSPDLVGLKEEA